MNQKVRALLDKAKNGNIGIHELTMAEIAECFVEFERVDALATRLIIQLVKQHELTIKTKTIAKSDDTEPK